MVHTSWTGRDGAPQGITAIAQTPDGILWIGGMGGLFTFDGVNFAPFDPKLNPPQVFAGTIRHLLVSQEGDLWVFWFHGSPACIHRASVRFYTRAKGEVINALDDGQQDSDGTLWGILNWQHLVRLGPDNIWHRVTDPVANTGHISRIFIDSSDTLWVIENNRLFRSLKGHSSFTATNIYVYGPAKLVENKDHTLWVMGQGPGPATSINLQHIDRDGHKLQSPKVVGSIADILVAPDDSLWIAQMNGVLQRLRNQKIPLDSSARSVTLPDQYSLKSAITDLGAQSLLSDADGNIWVAGMGGLDRFEHASLVPGMADSEIGVWFACAGKDGNVWVADGNGKLFRVSNESAIPVIRGGGSVSLSCGTEGRVYFVQGFGISLVRNGGVEHLPLLPGLSGYGDHYIFLGVLEQPDGDLIASVGGAAGHGLWKYSRGKWSPYLSELGLPEVCGMLIDNKGRLYVGFTQSDNTVGRIEGSSLTTLDGSGALEFAQTSYGVFAYGKKGVAVDREKAFQRISFLHPEQARLVTGVVESRSGDIWINGARGIVRIPAAEVRAAISDPTHAVSSVSFQEGDFVGPDVSLLFRRSAAIDPNGRLWFSTLNGVVSVDPDHLPAPRHAPLLSIRSIVADGHEMEASATFPPDTHTLDVKYFGLDLTDPRSVVYRYRLEGMGPDSQDPIWQEAGPRTEASYTNLRPGSYRFQVIASNGNDVWTQPVSSMTFRILPHFYQRPWVQGLFVLAGLLLAWFVSCQRIRYASAAIKIRAEERADERVRIARELHDTLLQGLQGLLLSFHVAAQKVPADHASKKALEKALATADRIIVEGRNRVSRLRSENLDDAELKSLIEGVGANFNTAGIDFAVERNGERDSLQSHVVDEVFCIAREAVTNAFRHSTASRIAVRLDYQKREFRMSCHDNGRGFDPVAVSANATNGHWGLRGMEERAERMGAEFACTSRADQGTEILVRVPARLAYSRSGTLEQLLRRLRAA